MKQTYLNRINKYVTAEKAFTIKHRHGTTYFFPVSRFVYHYVQMTRLNTVWSSGVIRPHGLFNEMLQMYSYTGGTVRIYRGIREVS